MSTSHATGRMRKRRKAVFVVAAGALMAAALAVGFAINGTASAQEVVKIGYSGPLSGGAALYGKNVLSGMEMAPARSGP